MAGFGGLLASLDTSVNIAFPAITRAFGINLMSIQWVVISYVLTYASLLLGCGRLADLFGHWRILHIGLLTSAAAFLVCGFARTFAGLLMGRMLQGLGVALIFGSAPALVTLAVNPAERGRALGFYQMNVATGFALGPLLGGVLVDVFGWRGVYLYRVLPALLMAWFTSVRVRPGQRPASGERFDLVGAVTLTLGAGALLLALSRSRDLGWTEPEVLVLALAGASSLVVFLVTEKRVAAPVINLDLFRRPAFTLANLLTLAANATRFPIGLLVPYYAVNILGYRPGLGGLLLFPAAVMTTCAAAFAGRLSDRMGTGNLSSVGLGVQSAGLWLTSGLDAGSDYSAAALALGMVGLGLGTFQVPNMSFIMGAVPREHQGVAGSIHQMMRTFGIVFGVTGASLLFERWRVSHADLGEAGAFVAAFQLVFLTVALLCALAAVVSLFRSGAMRQGAREAGEAASQGAGVSDGPARGLSTRLAGKVGGRGAGDVSCGRRANEVHDEVYQEVRGAGPEPARARTPWRSQSMSIERISPQVWNSRAVVHGDLVFLSGVVADDKSLSMKGQTEQVLAKIDEVLAAAGTDKSRILTATVHLADIDAKDEMNEAWMAWVDRDNLPARAAVGAALTPGTQVEIMVCAAR